MKIEKYYLIITSDNDKLSDVIYSIRIQHVICSKKISSKLAGHFLFAANNIEIYYLTLPKPKTLAHLF